MKETTKKLEFNDWLSKYFDKDSDHTYYTWVFTDDGMHPNDKSRYYSKDVKKEYEAYLHNTEVKGAYIDLTDYEE